MRGPTAQRESRVLRTVESAVIPAGGQVKGVAVLEIATPGEVARLLREPERFAAQAEVRVSAIETVAHSYGGDGGGFLALGCEVGGGGGSGIGVEVFLGEVTVVRRWRRALHSFSPTTLVGSEV